MQAGTAKVTVASQEGKVSTLVLFTIDPSQIKQPSISRLSPGLITAVIQASDIMGAGSAQVTAKNLESDGGTPKVVRFMVHPREKR
jgi:hypothetical protein